MTPEERFSLAVLRLTDEILLDYIERVEKTEGSGLFFGRRVALEVKTAMSLLEDKLRKEQDVQRT